ncbi:hypothetical protein PTSG_10244 [Salpingoeca rosetta]|uniref:Phosphoglycerate mutase n=1 Tax=Salpingoeca rosetta (strain ATCC 50818 / BSB-021) TaxID=946362 RepID=F2UQQ7_SALR5|nr:uncharacterized protein PTSG_10244 [Salpingoeca rosetta]EGD79962.1 hypothetical protein PTSG_10244 [Salpingoeca rosetta]|eukprot:XP_004988583.1 hypothetical protein PTSG_10244 [Salpingoeca rosetta]
MPHRTFRVWEEDAKDAAHTKFNVESVQTVVDRTRALLMELNDKHHNATIVLVAHGDTLQICQTWVQRLPLTTHRNVEYLGNADLRKIASGPP